MLASIQRFTKDQLYSTASYRERNLSGIVLGGNDLSSWNLSDQDLSGAYFSSADLRHADLSGADLSHTDAVSADLSGANLAGANLTRANLARSNLHGADLRSASLSGAGLGTARLNDANLSNADLSGATFYATDVTNAEFSGADIRRARMYEMTKHGFTPQHLYSTRSYQTKNLQGIQLDGNDLSGWNFRNQDLSRAVLGQSDLSGSDLSGADLTEASMWSANLTRANLSGANLTESYFDQAVFSGANLDGATLRGARLNRATARGFTKELLYSTKSYADHSLQDIHLSEADLSGWDLSGKDLSKAYFYRSSLRRTNFSGANLTDTNFRATKLTDAQFAGATIEGASFAETTATICGLTGCHKVPSFTKEQLYSTASYQAGNLRGIDLSNNNLSSWNFRGQDLTNASLRSAIVEGADLSDATIVGADLGGLTASGLSQDKFAATASYKSKDLRGVQLGGNDLTSWDFRGQDLTNASLSGANLKDARFAGALIAGVDFEESQFFSQELIYLTASYKNKHLPRLGLAGKNIDGWDFRGHDLSGATLPRTMEHTDFSEADVSGMHFGGRPFVSPSLTDVTFAGAKMKGVYLGGKLTSVDLSGADLTDATIAVELEDVNMTGAVIRRANLTSAVANGLSKELFYSTASYQSEDLRGVRFSDNDLSGWDLVGQDLTDAAFDQVEILAVFGGGHGSLLPATNLSNANLTGATLSNANLNRARLSGTNLTASLIDSADLANTTSRGFTKEQLYSTASYETGQLQDIVLARNDLSGWNFDRQELQAADFREADLENASFVNADLTGADLLDATGFSPDDTTVTRNLMWPDGRLHGVDIRAGERLTFKPRAVAVIEDSFEIAESGVLELSLLGRTGELCCEPEGTRLNLAEGVTVEIGGTLHIVAEGLPYIDEGWAFRLFDWSESLELTDRFESVELPAGAWDVSRLYTSGEVTLVTEYASYEHLGDLNVDGQQDAEDLDRLSSAIRFGRDLSYDLNRDARLDEEDRRVWIEEYAETSLGDANLDGTIGFADFLTLSDSFGQSGGWAQGDFNGNGNIEFGDFLLLSENFLASTPSGAAVPEPTAKCVLLNLIVMLLVYRRRSMRSVSSHVAPNE